MMSSSHTRSGLGEDVITSHHTNNSAVCFILSRLICAVHLTLHGQQKKGGLQTQSSCLYPTQWKVQEQTIIIRVSSCSTSFTYQHFRTYHICSFLVDQYLISSLEHRHIHLPFVWHSSKLGGNVVRRTLSVLCHGCYVDQVPRVQKLYQLSAPLKSWFLWIFLYQNVIEPHQSCTHHMVSQPVLSWHSYDGRPTTEIHPRSYLAATNSCMNWTRKSEVSYLLPTCQKYLPQYCPQSLIGKTMGTLIGYGVGSWHCSINISTIHHHLRHQCITT